MGSLGQSSIHVASLGDVASAGTPGAGDPFFAPDKVLPKRTMLLALTIAVDTDSIVTAVIGGASILLNDGNAILANTAWGGEVAARAGTFNLKISSAGKVTYLAVQAKYGGN